jgi:hypothetical protein
MGGVSSSASLTFQAKYGIPVDEVAGLWPKTWIAVGPGFAREEVKALILEQGRALTGRSITSLADIAAQILRHGAGPGARELELLSPSSRQEALRRLVADRRILARLPEIKRLKRQRGFFRKLDRAVQAARLAVAHADEEAVLTERLLQHLGESQYRVLRDEVLLLCRAYEAWLLGHPSGLADQPRLLRDALTALTQGGWPEKLEKPEKLLYFSGAYPESLERAFSEELARHLVFERVGPLETPPSVPEALALQWERWHTLDDAAERLADALVERPFEEQVVLIADDPSVRRMLKRVFAQRGIEQADARDPNRLRWDETLKWALLPLEVVASDFERENVSAWCEHSGERMEIAARGIRQGLRSYAGGALAPLHARLSELGAELGGRKNLQQVSEFHLELLRKATVAHPECAWCLRFLERLWGEVEKDHSRFERADRRAPLRYWLERLNAALADAPSPMEPLKSQGGVQVYRLHQVSLIPFKKVWIFGMSDDFLSGASVGDYALSEREREILSGEFGVRSSLETRKERMAALASWLSTAEDAVLLDAHYDWDAGERESLLPLLRELKDLSPDLGALKAPEERGSHPRYTPSFSAIRPLPPQSFELAPLAAPEITASDLDRYSRCALQALGYQRWRVNDTREPEADLWPDVKGNLLHHSVRLLLQSRDAEGRFTLTAAQALDQAWAKRRPKGLLQGRRVELYARSRLEQVLSVFMEKELEFEARAGSRTRVLDDDLRFRVDFGDFVVKGTPDRIEETDDGVFVMDYKSSSASPNGTEMLELGYRLQLPFYALAAEAELKRPVLGLQFVELTRKGSRSSGIFFPRYNGKEPGKLTKAAPNSKSLLKSMEPDEVWARMKEHVLATGRAYVQGRFAAAPRIGEKECGKCGLSDLCGYRRKSGDGSEGEADS